MTVAARVLKFTRQAFYQWVKNPVSAREVEDAELVDKIRLIHDDDPEFGYQFITDELHAQSVKISERRVWRLCSKAQIFSVITRRKPRGKKPGPPVHDDLLQRHFHADAPNIAWVTDITEHWTGQGKLYVCAIKDLYSLMIVGYASSARMTSRLAVAALDDAMRKHGRPKGAIMHSDRGSQLSSWTFVRALKKYKAKGSMGRVGACGDNAAMESFFALLQKNVLDHHSWGTCRELSMAITHWIERTYYRKRRQRALGKLTPSNTRAS